MSENKTQLAVQNTRALLREKLELLDRVRFSEPFNLELSFANVKETKETKFQNLVFAHLKEWAGRRSCIYELSVCDISLAEELAASFLQAKEDRRRGYALPKFNNSVRSNTLYVGQSKSVANRLKQHVFSAPTATYALNLSRWVGGIDGMLSISVWALEESCEPSILQDIEDSHWVLTSPIFGRKGAR